MSEIVAELPGRAPDHASNWRVRQVIARTRWQLIAFHGAAGGCIDVEDLNRCSGDGACFGKPHTSYLIAPAQDSLHASVSTCPNRNVQVTLV
jgi:hypothetical protein